MIAEFLLRRAARDARARGDAAREARRWPEAAAAYQRYLAIRPEDAGIWKQLGHALTEARELDEADLAYRTAWQRQPGDADLLLCWGHSRKLAGDTEAARDLYTRSFAIDGNADAAENLATLPPEPEPESEPESAIEPEPDPVPEPEPEAAPEPPADPEPAWTARFEVVKPFVMPAGEVALFVTRSCNGALPPHVPPYLRALREEGIHILLIGMVDHPLDIPADILALVDGAIVRENKGFAFAGWAHAVWLHPELYGAAILYLIEDSVVGPVGDGRFARLIERVRASGADLVGLTESHVRRWHVQRYFWAMKPRLLGSFDLHIFFRRIRLLTDLEQAIDHYELSFAFDVEQWGLKVQLLFPSTAAGEPLRTAWRALLRDGFPFVDLALLRDGSLGAEDWRELGKAGFDLALLEAAIRAPLEAVPQDPTHLLSAHPPARDRDRTRPLRIAFYGPLAHGGELGDGARALAESLRRLGHRLNLHPLTGPFRSAPLLAPAVAVAEFNPAPDIAIVQLAPDELHLLSDAQRDAIAAAPRRIGCWRGEQERIPDSWRAAFLSVDRIWASDPRLATLLADDSDTPVDLIPLTEAGRIEASLRRTMTRDRPPAPEAWLAPRLTAGIAFETADLGDRMRVLALAPDGSVEGLPDDFGGDADHWVAIAPRGTLIAPDFARIVGDHARARPDARIFYADDIAVETEEPVDQIRLKPEFDPYLLAAQDYVGAPLIVRASALGALGGVHRAMRTAAAADLLFRAAAAGLSIARIPEVLLAYPGERVRPTAEDYRRMLASQPLLTPYEIGAGRVPGSFALRRRFGRELPAVTLIVPTRRAGVAGTGSTHIEQLLDTLGDLDWPMDRLEVLVGDDVPGEPDWARREHPFALRRVETPRRANEPFNYAAKMNRLWRLAESEQIVFLNDDMRPLDGKWLAALQTFAVDPSVGGVGARLLFEDGSLQHAGIAPHSLAAGHVWVNRRRLRGTYQDWALVHRQWSMVTGALFATRRSLMEEVAGFDEHFSLEFNDTDLCLRLRMRGYRIVCTPDAELVHVERASRGDAPPHGQEIARFLTRWSPFFAADPAWHPALRLDRVDMTPKRDPHAWYM